MSNFKIGDIVVGNQDSAVNYVEQGQLYEVLAAEQEHGYDYVKTDLNPGTWVLSERFNLYKGAAQAEQDDPLPPAPESVRYYNSYIVGRNDQHLILDGHNDNHPGMNLMYLGIVPRTGSTRATKEIGINMDADTALQLAHDLRRMAMDIKRKEKQHV